MDQNVRSYKIQVKSSVSEPSRRLCRLLKISEWTFSVCIDILFLSQIAKKIMFVFVLLVKTNGVRVWIQSRKQ